jgi:hypothetical protein
LGKHVHAGVLPMARHCELGPQGEGTQGLPLGSSGDARITGALPVGLQAADKVITEAELRIRQRKLQFSDSEVII